MYKTLILATTISSIYAHTLSASGHMDDYDLLSPTAKAAVNAFEETYHHPKQAKDRAKTRAAQSQRNIRKQHPRTSSGKKKA